MANIDPPPPLPLPLPLAVPEPTHQAKPVTAQINLKDVPAPASPADSDRTVIAHARPRRVVAQPGGAAAVFSTNGGCMPRRNALNPEPPVIVCSDPVAGVVAHATYWYHRCPDLYHCFFPGAGWTITDLWDDADIRLNSPGFLEEVLKFITQDNLSLASNFAWTWSQQHPDKVDILGGDVSDLRVQGDELNIVDKFFSDIELVQWPREFLLRVLCILRVSMRSYNRKYRAAEIQGGEGQSVETRQPRPMQEKHAVAEETTQTPVVAARQQSAYAGQSCPTRGHAPSATNAQLVQHPPFTPSQPQQPVPVQGDGLNMNHRAVMISGYEDGNPHYTARPTRAGSNTFPQPPQVHGWAENIRMPSGAHMPHPSGPPPSGVAPRFGPPMPMRPGMVHPLHPGPPFPLNTPMTSPLMHPSQMQCSPMVPPNMMFSPPGPIPPQLNDPSLQHFGPNGPGARGGPFVDMANIIQYPPVRGFDARGVPRRNTQSSKPTALFNPYGAERPDKAGFTITGAGRKGGRGTFTNNASRSSKYSSGTFDRPGFGPGPQAADYAGNGARFNSGHYPEGLQMRNTSHNFEINESIVNDKEHGCHYTWIGPKNNTVRQLYVRNLPDSVNGNEIQALFQQCTDVTPIGVEIKYNGERKENVHAFVQFSSTDDARKVLDHKNMRIGGNELEISVAKRYFSLQHYHARDPYVSDTALQRQPRRTFGDSNGPAGKPVHYSPQDARSDRHGVNRQEQQELSAARGSPEARKTKKNLSGKNTSPRLSAQQDNDLKTQKSLGRSVTPTVPADDNTQRDDSMDARTVSITEVVDVAETTKVEINTVADEKPTITTTPETVTGGERGAVHSAHQPHPGEAGPEVSEISDHVSTGPTEKLVDLAPTKPSPTATKAGHAAQESISESIPTDSETHPLNSLTKVALPPKHGPAKKDARKAGTVSTAAKDEQKTITASSRAKDETPSDDDQKNDLSFHSAQESQQSPDNEEDQEPLEPTETHVENDRSSAAAAEDAQPPVPQKEHDKRQQGQGGSTGDASVPGPPHNRDGTLVSGKSVAEAGKKLGAKQTESLHPFAKHKKSQAKKEKPGKKRKTKAEITNKGEAQGEEAKPNDTADTPGEKETDAISSGNVDKIIAKDSKDDEVPARQSVLVHETHQDFLGQSSAGISPHTVSPLEKTDADVDATGETIFPSVRFASPPREKDQTQVPGKKVKPVLANVAVPTLEHLRRKSSPTSATTPPHTAYFSVASPSPEAASTMTNATEGHPPRQDVKAPSVTPENHDSASMASSCTVRGPSPPLSASPSGKEFHTPLQTPTAPGTAPVEVAKRKKKKSKKKKSTNKEGALLDEDTEEGPFHDQFREVARQPGYYSLRGSDLPAQEVPGRKEDKTPKSLIRQVHAYVKEKTSVYARVPQSAWDKDNRKETEKLPPAQYERLVQAPLLSTSKGMPLEDDSRVEVGSPSKVKKAGVVPFFGE